MTPTFDPVPRAQLHPVDWATCLSGQPMLDRALHGAVPALVRRWQGIDPAHCAERAQPALSVGPSRWRQAIVPRWRRPSADLRRAGGAHSVVPAGAAFQWRTEGPIDFLHVYVAPATMDAFVSEAFDDGDRSLMLGDRLGEIDPLIASLAMALAEELTDRDVSNSAYLDDIIQLLLYRMLRRQAADATPPARVLHALPPYRLKRALEFIEDRLDQAIGVAEIAAVAGTSAFHFSRAFRSAMGQPPYAYLLDRRVARAKLLLGAGKLSLPEIAGQCGFAGPSQLARAFRRATGASPTSYRNSH